MASGHVNRIQRPNTWLHRPSLRREDSPCQPGVPGCPHSRRVPEGNRTMRGLWNPGADDPEAHQVDIASVRLVNILLVPVISCVRGSRNKPADRLAAV
jgi:hypothetical protein